MTITTPITSPSPQHNVQANFKCKAARHGSRKLLLPLLLMLSSALGASTPPTASPAEISSPLAGAAPHALIVDVAANEIRAIEHKDSYLRYRMRKVDAKGDRVRDTIESANGAVARLILKQGKPISTEEDNAERDRLDDMINSPSEFNKHLHSDVTGKRLAVDLIQLMPDAMLYTYTPGQPQIASPLPHQIVIDYNPNPRWSPPTTTSAALTGLRGRMWIDPRTHSLIRMEGEIFQGVNFGWGMLAHIYPGGKLALDQVNVAGDRWIFSRFVEDLRVRALMLKTIDVHESYEASVFQVLPGPLSYQDAIHMLLNTPLPTE